jgi:hypothetical protein
MPRNISSLGLTSCYGGHQEHRLGDMGATKRCILKTIQRVLRRLKRPGSQKATCGACAIRRERHDRRLVPLERCVDVQLQLRRRDAAGPLMRDPRSLPCPCLVLAAAWHWPGGWQQYGSLLLLLLLLFAAC